MVLLCVVLLLTSPLVFAAPKADLVEQFPGWYQPLPSKVYSGFIDSDHKGWMHTHYMFVESENKPESDPVVLWFNGGPGASSVFGLFIELGPFILSDQSLQTQEYNATGVPSVFYNHYAWSKVANVLIINSPPPVGFSYCDTFGPSGNGSSCGDWNDKSTAESNHIFLLNWLKAFPEYNQNPLYPIGESYAGIYVPNLVQEILNDPHNKINLQGFAVGDACVGTEVYCGINDGPYWDVLFMFGHGQLSTKLYNKIMSVCDKQALMTGHGISRECSALLDQRLNQIGGFYEYNLYDECWYENDATLPTTQSDTRTRRTYWGPPPLTPRANDLLSSYESRVRSNANLGSVINDYPCGGYAALLIYLNSTTVRKNLHIPLDAKFFDSDGTGDGGFNYTQTEKNLMPFYAFVARHTNLRALVFNGDTDPSVNVFVAQNWTSTLGLEEVKAWRPWTLDGKERMGGFVTEYEGNMHMLTIRGSGHMVAEFKPAAALEFLTRWLNNEDWKPYTPPKRATTLTRPTTNNRHLQQENLQQR